MTIHVVVDIDVVAGQLDHVVDSFRELVEETLREEGCLQFDVFRCETEENRLVLIEAWADQAAIDLHMKAEHTDRFLDSVRTAFPHPPRARRVQPVNG